MLLAAEERALSVEDERVYDLLVYRDHPLRRSLQVIDFARLRELATSNYSVDLGRPSIEPTVLIKLSMLQYIYGLSDRMVLDRAQTDVGFRFFLRLRLGDSLPDSSSMSTFRSRLGEEGFRKLFDSIVAGAKEAGLVKSRLRLTDATHVIADIAVPSTLALVAEARDRLLDAAVPFAPQRALGDRLAIDVYRASTDQLPDEERLAARVTHLREILQWCTQLAAPDGLSDEELDQDSLWSKFQAAREVALKILGDRDDPQRGDRTVSVVDPDARTGKHGEFFVGYKLDILMDADSELITNIDVLSATGLEPECAMKMAEYEQQRHGTDIQSLSIDAIGNDGAFLHAMQSADGPNIEVIVPPKTSPSHGLFTPDQFRITEDGSSVICPAGHTSTSRHRQEEKHTTIYRFPIAHCGNCPLMAQCITGTNPRNGRSVRKNDFDSELARNRERAQTEHHQKVRKQHPKVERKISELVRRQGMRRARFRGRLKVRVQAFLAATVVNIKRILCLVPFEFPNLSH